MNFCYYLKLSIMEAGHINLSSFSTGSFSSLQVWDIRDGKCIRTLTPPGSSLGSFLSSMTSETQINDLKLSANGSLLFSAMGTTVRIWDLDRWVMRHITQAQLKRVDMTFVLFKVLFLFSLQISFETWKRSSLCVPMLLLFRRRDTRILQLEIVLP